MSINIPTLYRDWSADVAGRWIDTGKPNVDRHGKPTTPECIDLTRDWAMVLGADEKAYGHAVDFARNLAREPGWKAGDPAGYIPAGSVVSVITAKGGRWPEPYGHVVVTGTDMPKGVEDVTLTEQNPTPARTRRTTIPRSAIVAVAVPVVPPALRRVVGLWIHARHAPGGAVIGRAPRGTILTPTGRTSPDGQWFEAATPWQAARGLAAWYTTDPVLVKEVA